MRKFFLGVFLYVFWRAGGVEYEGLVFSWASVWLQPWPALTWGFYQGERE